MDIPIMAGLDITYQSACRPPSAHIYLLKIIPIIFHHDQKPRANCRCRNCRPHLGPGIEEGKTLGLAINVELM